MINVTTTALKNHKVKVIGGYVLLNGFGLRNDQGGLYTVNGIFPYCLKSKGTVDMIAKDGLTEGAKFL